MAVLYDTGIFSVINSDSSIGVGWKLNFYASGTTTRKATYPTAADATALTNANANPVVADAGGRFAQIWLTDTSYKAVLTDAADIVKATRDPAVYSASSAATDASNLSTGTLPAGRMPALTGDVTTTIGTVATTIAAGAVTLAKQADMATASVVYRKTAGTGAPEVQTLATLKTDLGLTGTNSGDQTIALTSDVTGTGTGSFATTIAAGVVTNAKLANVSTATFKGRTTAGTGSPEDLTVTQATALLNAMVGDSGSGGTKGLVTAPAAGDAAAGKFLKADATWAVPSGGGGGTTTNALTMNNGGAGVASGTTFDGSVARTLSYNTLGAAPLASPTFTGTPAAPTAASATSTTQIATTAFVQQEKASAIQSVASAATVTPTFLNDQVEITALAAACQLLNPTGTAVRKGIAIRIKDNGTARALTYDTQYRAIGVTLPSTTVISKTLYLGMIWNPADTKWDVVAVAREA